MIYFDNASTTKIDNDVLSALNDFYIKSYGNTSSNHIIGENLNQIFQDASSKIIELLGLDDHEIIFTSGATESINLALKGFALKYVGEPLHIITNKSEHKAVLETCEYLESIGVGVSYLFPSSNGDISIDDIKKEIKKETKLVCIMQANNETGIINDIESISNYLYENDIDFFCDATQAIGKVNSESTYKNCSAIAFSAHKFHGPIGVGALVFKKGFITEGIMHGGSQQDGLRAGTINLPLIYAMTKALEKSISLKDERINHLLSLRNHLENNLKQILDVEIHGENSKRLPNISNLYFPTIPYFLLESKLKEKFAFSNGSACNASVVQASHVLRSMHLNEEEASSSIRISFSSENTIEEVDLLLKEITELILK